MAQPSQSISAEITHLKSFADNREAQYIANASFGEIFLSWRNTWIHVSSKPNYWLATEENLGGPGKGCAPAPAPTRRQAPGVAQTLCEGHFGKRLHVQPLAGARPSASITILWPPHPRQTPPHPSRPSEERTGPATRLTSPSRGSQGSAQSRRPARTEPA